MSIYSHIQLPNGILQYFRDETSPEKKVWYLDIDTGEIRSQSSKRLGTSKDYYSQEIEKFWDRFVESPITALNKKLRDFAEGRSDAIDLTQRDRNIALRYIKAAVVRSKIAYSEMRKKSKTVSLFSEQKNHDDLAYFGMKSKGAFDQILEDKGLIPLVNMTERPMVVPRNCFYCAPFESEESIIAPISPWCAILLVPETCDYYQNHRYAQVIDPEEIAYMNILALKYEYVFNGTFIAASDYEELVQLQAFRKDHLIELNKLNCYK